MLFILSVQYQMDMMRCLRHVNIDHLHVGWYQSSFHGNFVNRPFLDSQFSYQNAIDESIVLIYGWYSSYLYVKNMQIMRSIFFQTHLKLDVGTYHWRRID